MPRPTTTFTKRRLYCAAARGRRQKLRRAGAQAGQKHKRATPDQKLTRGRAARGARPTPTRRACCTQAPQRGTGGGRASPRLERARGSGLQGFRVCPPSAPPAAAAHLKALVRAALRLLLLLLWAAEAAARRVSAVGRRDGPGSGPPAWRSSGTRLLRYFRRLPANLAGARERAVHCERRGASAKRSNKRSRPESPRTARSRRTQAARRSRDRYAPLPMAEGGS